MNAAGVKGELRYGYQTAALLSKWALTPAVGGGSRCDAKLKDINEYWLAMSPLTVVLSLGSRRWVWEVQDLRLHGASAVIMVKGQPTL